MKVSYYLGLVIGTLWTALWALGGATLLVVGIDGHPKVMTGIFPVAVVCWLASYVLVPRILLLIARFVLLVFRRKTHVVAWRGLYGAPLIDACRESTAYPRADVDAAEKSQDFRIRPVSDVYGQTYTEFGSAKESLTHRWKARQVYSTFRSSGVPGSLLQGSLVPIQQYGSPMKGFLVCRGNYKSTRH